MSGYGRVNVRMEQNWLTVDEGCDGNGAGNVVMRSESWI